MIRDPPQHTWSSRGELMASVGRGYKVYRTHAGIGEDTNTEPWDINYHLEERSPFAPVPPLPLEGDLRPEQKTLEHSKFRTAAPRKLSPASALRTPLDKKQGPGSSISTPRPSPVVLHSDDTQVTAPTVEVVVPAKAHGGSKTPKSQSRSRPRSARVSEKQMAERALSQDISAIIRRRVLQGYGLGSVRMYPRLCSLLTFLKAKFNSEIVAGDSGSEDTLSNIWQWLHSKCIVLVSRLY